MVIDDLANRSHDCDVLLDQNYSKEGAQRYIGLIGDSCKLLVGPRYALLRPEYMDFRKTMSTRDGYIGKVLVYFGGSDYQNMTGLSLKALSCPQFSHLSVDVVIGLNNPNREMLENLARKRPRTTVLFLCSHLADLMAHADLSIGASGATTWERMCLGLPTIVITLAENQLSAARALADAKLVHYAGHYDNIQLDQLTNLLENLLQTPQKLASLSTQNQIEVDGLGLLRVIEVMVPHDVHEIQLRPASEKDFIHYYNWANNSESEVKKGDKLTINWDAHYARYLNQLLDVNSHLFLLELGGLPVGQIRIDREAENDYIDYEFDSILQERGCSHRLVALGLDLMHRIQPILIQKKTINKVRTSPSAYVCLRLRTTSNDFTRGSCHSIAILSNLASWVNEYIQALMLDWLKEGHRVQWVHDVNELLPGDFCFYLGCGQIVSPKVLSQYKHNLVVHESDLPRGKGWSPLTWQILEKINKIPVTLFEAMEKVDSGLIYAQDWIEFEGYELIDDLRKSQAKATIELCKRFIDDYPQICEGAREQVGDSSFYPHRYEVDSGLDPLQTIEAQFNLLRVVDNCRYPAFFYLNGQRYVLRIERDQSHKGEQGIST